MKMNLIVAGLLLAGASVALAQGQSGTPQLHSGRPSGESMQTPAYPFAMMGRWWLDPGLVAAVGLKPEQVTKLDKLMGDNRDQMTQLHTQISQTQKDLQATLDAPVVDTKKALAVSDQLADEQDALQKSMSHVLVAERAELTADQWAKLKAAHPHEGMRGHMEMHGKSGGTPEGAPPAQ